MGALRTDATSLWYHNFSQSINWIWVLMLTLLTWCCVTFKISRTLDIKRAACIFAWHRVICSSGSTDLTEHTNIPTDLYLLEFRATWGQNLLCHQQPVVLINPGMEGRNHLPSCVPISSRAAALVFPHIRRMFQDTRQTNGGSLFHTALGYSFFLLQPHCFFILSLSFSSGRPQLA